MSKRQPPMVEVIWLDAHGGSNDWRPVRKKDHAAVEVRSVGMLIMESEDGVTLAQSYNAEADHVDHTLYIPAGNIDSLRKLRYR